MTNKQTQENLDSEFLKRVFSNTEDGEEFPLIDPPEDLGERLYRIPRKRRRIQWAFFGSVAASVLLVVAMVAPQKTGPNAQVLEVQRELEIAFSYLDKANTKANKQVITTLSSQLQKATVVPVVETVNSI